MSLFDEARASALISDLLAFLRGRPTDLLPFDAVREQLGLTHVVDRGFMEVPLDAIAGSVGRERDFNRLFLPRDDSLRERWQDIDGLAEGPLGFPPVELYRVGTTYFVVDGHHRVSVARALGARTIEAHVREYLTPVPLAPDASLEDVLLKRGLAEFCEKTGLAPQGADEFRTTEPGGYERMLEHIGVHRYFTGIERGAPVAWSEAVASWLERFYRPIADRIRASGVLADFPARTEADLYLFVMDHLHYLKQRYGTGARPARAAQHFALLRRANRRSLWRRRFR